MPRAEPVGRGPRGGNIGLKLNTSGRVVRMGELLDAAELDDHPLSSFDTSNNSTTSRSSDSSTAGTGGGGGLPGGGRLSLLDAFATEVAAGDAANPDDDERM